MRPLNTDFKTVNYLDTYGNPLGKGYMSRSNNLIDLRFKEAYRMIVSNPSWEDCVMEEYYRSSGILFIDTGLIAPEYYVIGCATIMMMCAF